MADSVSDHVLVLVDSRVASTPLGENVIEKMCEAFDPFPSATHHKTQMCTDMQLEIRGIEMHKRHGDGRLQRIRYRFITEEEWPTATAFFGHANYATTSTDKEVVVVVQAKDAAAKKRIKQLRFASPLMMEVEVLVVDRTKEHRDKFALLMANTARALSSKKDRSGPMLGTKSVRVDMASKCGLRKLHHQQLEMVGQVNVRLKKAVKGLEEINPREIRESVDSSTPGALGDLYGRTDGEVVIKE